MRNLLKYSALLVAAMVLIPVDGFAQGNGQGRPDDKAGASQRAQVERGQDDRDRVRDRDRMQRTAHNQAEDQLKVKERNQKREMVEEQKRVQAPEAGKGPESGIYGYELMSEQERNRYREQLRLVQSDPEQKTRFLAQHREKMQARAKARGVGIDESAKPGKPE